MDVGVGDRGSQYPTFSCRNMLLFLARWFSEASFRSPRLSTVEHAEQLNARMSRHTCDHDELGVKQRQGVAVCYS